MLKKLLLTCVVLLVAAAAFGQYDQGKNMNYSVNVGGWLRPTISGRWALGDTTHRWRSIYVDSVFGGSYSASYLTVDSLSGKKVTADTVKATKRIVGDSTWITLMSGNKLSGGIPLDWNPVPIQVAWDKNTVADDGLTMNTPIIRPAYTQLTGDGYKESSLRLQGGVICLEATSWYNQTMDIPGKIIFKVGPPLRTFEFDPTGFTIENLTVNTAVFDYSGLPVGRIDDTYPRLAQYTYDEFWTNIIDSTWFGRTSKTDTLFAEKVVASSDYIGMYGTEATGYKTSLGYPDTTKGVVVDSSRLDLKGSGGVFWRFGNAIYSWGHDLALNSGFYSNSNQDLWINFRGYQNGTDYYRGTCIANGKSAPIAYFQGSTKLTTLYGNLLLDAPGSQNIIYTNQDSYLDLRGGENVGYKTSLGYPDTTKGVVIDSMRIKFWNTGWSITGTSDLTFGGIDDRTLTFSTSGSAGNIRMEGPYGSIGTGRSRYPYISGIKANGYAVSLGCSYSNGIADTTKGVVIDSTGLRTKMAGGKVIADTIEATKGLKAIHVNIGPLTLNENVVYHNWDTPRDGSYYTVTNGDILHGYWPGLQSIMAYNPTTATIDSLSILCCGGSTSDSIRIGILPISADGTVTGAWRGDTLGLPATLEWKTGIIIPQCQIIKNDSTFYLEVFPKLAGGGSATICKIKTYWTLTY